MDMDERTEEIVLRAMAITLGLVWIYVLIVVIWKVFSTSNIFTGTTDIVLLILMPASVWWFSREAESIALPRTMLGRELPVGLDHESRLIRRRSYLTEAFGLSFGWTILTLIVTFIIEDSSSKLLLFPSLSNSVNYILIFGTELIIGFAIMYSLKSIDGEYTIKKYHQKLDALEE